MSFLTHKGCGRGNSWELALGVAFYKGVGNRFMAGGMWGIDSRQEVRQLREKCCRCLIHQARQWPTNQATTGSRVTIVIHAQRTFGLLAFYSSPNRRKFVT